MIEKIVDLAESLTPIALVGPGGIGKTSIALTVLHHGRIKEHFGDNRRFIRCDQFPTSSAHLLSKLSKVIGAGVENPEDLTPLRPFLSSRKIILVLDNAESILDPRGMDAHEIYTIVEELSKFGNICLCITSRISTIPPTCESFDVPTLSVVASRDTFNRIYKDPRQSDLMDGILEQLEFHPLSIDLLATVAHHNRWDVDRLSREWKRQRTDVLRTKHDTSLAATIELSLASPTFQDLGPDARDLLGVVAFFPQGIDENNLNWLFPTVPNRTDIFNDFCILSLTYRNGGFVTMLAPLRDYLCPKDPRSSPLLCKTKDHYFRRLSALVDPGEPGFDEAQWIRSEDVNVEHLLDIFTSIDANSIDVWDVCSNFMRHLYWHKPRLVALGPKIEGLPDGHPSKPKCLDELSLLFDSIGNRVESKHLLTCSLKLWREWGDDRMVAYTLWAISIANGQLGFNEEGIQQVEEALEIYQRLNDVTGQARSLQQLGWLLFEDKQLDAAEEAASKAISLLDKGDQFHLCDCYLLLGNIYCSRGETEKAIDHYEAALRIASAFNWHDSVFWIHHSLADLLFEENRFGDAHIHAEHAKSQAINNPYTLGRGTELQAKFWYRQGMLEEAKSEVLRAIDIYEKIAMDVEDCRALLRAIEQEASRESVSSWIRSYFLYLLILHSQPRAHIGHHPTGPYGCIRVRIATLATVRMPHS